MSVSSYTFTSKTTDFTTNLSSPINLNDKRCEVALVRFETYNSFPNIKKDVNNIFRYSPDNGATWKEIIFDTGSYELKDISIEIDRQMVNNGDYDTINNETFINIIGLTLHTIVIIKHDRYKVDFGGRYSIGSLLGFPSVILNEGYHKSPKIVDISSLISIFVNVDIISGSYINGTNAQTIYTFAPNVKPGGKIIEAPTPHEYLPIPQSMK